MSYKALLFCPDEKTARVVTQVLSDLEFRVEPCNEPFAAVKKLMAEHFDAIVVDCDNEQNAALLFKSAHNSGTNQASLAVAVVEGQTGVAKAFRIGANLVLTKPINVEQSKGTLRVARGLLRKSDAAKPASSAPTTNSSPRPAVTSTSTDAMRPTASVPKPSYLPAQPPPSPIPAMSAAFDVEEEHAPKLEPTEAALLESMAAPLETKNHAGEPPATPTTSKEYPWQPISKPMAGPMATALRRAAEAAGKSEVESPAASKLSHEPSHGSDAAMGRSFTTSMPSGQAAATAPAKAPLKADKPAELHHAEAPTLPSLTAAAAEPPSGGSKKLILIAAVLVVAAAAGYVGWTKMHPTSGATITQRPAAPMQTAPVQAQPPVAAVVLQSPAPAQQNANLPASTSPLPIDQKQDQRMERKSEPAPTVTKTSPEPKKSTSIIASNTVVRTPADTNADATDNAPAPMVVKHQVPSPAPSSPAPQDAAQPPAPSLLSDASPNNAEAISGIVSAPAANLPTHPESVKLSQGVSQGLLIKNVKPVYPPLARQLRIQGDVQLQANISKEGNITTVKLISGDSALAHAAIDAVKQWKYKPYYLDGQPVEIQTQVTVKFKLP
jgi:periplasmic protein TonB